MNNIFGNPFGGFGSGVGRRLRRYMSLPLQVNLLGPLGSAAFVRNSSQYCVDNLGDVQQIPAGVPCFDGMRWDGVLEEWFDTDLAGDPLTTGRGGILLEPLSTNKCECYGIVPADEIGAESVLNNDFSGAWTGGLPAEHTLFGTTTGTEYLEADDINDRLRMVAGSTFIGVSQPVSVKGRVYDLEVDIESIASGTLSLYIGSSPSAANKLLMSAPGIHTLRVVNDGSTNVAYLFGNTGSDVSLNSWSIKEVANAIGTKSFHDGSTFIQNIPGMTLSGDVAGVLSIVADQAAVDAAIATEQAKDSSLWDVNLLCALQLARANGYKVLKLDNSLGGGNTSAYVDGVPGNLNIHSGQVIWSGSGSGKILIGATDEIASAFPVAYTQKTRDNITPIGLGSPSEIRTLAGASVNFLTPQLEELPFSTSIMPSEGASATRLATILTATPTIYTSGTWHKQMYWTPRAVVAGRVETLIDCMSDANNGLRVISEGTEVYIEKMVAGVSERATLTMTPVADTQYVLDARMLATNELSLFVDDVGEGTNTSTTASVVLRDTIYIGSDGVTATYANIELLTLDNVV